MFKLESGVLDKTRMVSNILMIVLLAGNVYLTTQYIESIKAQSAPVVDNTSRNIKIDRFLQEFITIVLNTNGTVSTDDRVKLENDVRQIGDPEVLTQWQAFVNSTDAKTAQANAIKLMSMLSAKMLEGTTIVQS